MKALLILTIILVMMGQTTAQARSEKAPSKKKLQCVNINSRIQDHREETQALRHQMGFYTYRTVYSELRSPSCRYREWVHHLWKKRHRDAWIRWRNPPHKKEWMCIHRYEGSWTDPNKPFWGGLQMDEGFQKAYGHDLYQRKGTADHWTPLEQMWTSEKAWKVRGFTPWPTTARLCGLL